MRTHPIPLLATLLLVSLQISASTIPHRNGNAAPPEVIQQALFASLEGQVTDQRTGSPIANARVFIPSFSLEGVTDSEGNFSWSSIPVQETETPITVTAQAEGYGEWTLQDVRLRAGDTLILEPALTMKPYVSRVPRPRSEQPELWSEREAQLLALMAAPAPPATLPLPENIRVRVSGSPYGCDTSRAYEVKVVNFRQYVKHVLPNEWGLWHTESLRAGAMAVKMYAWYMIALGGKWSDADVWDSTCDQVYNPNFSYTSMNNAVDDIWDQVLSYKGTLFPTYYRAHYYQCEDANLAGKCMGQWDSKDMAESGYTWDQILALFFKDTSLAVVKPAPINGFSLRFNGGAADYRENRVLIPIDDPTTSLSGPPADIGAESFTVEWWLKADTQGNSAPAVSCGANKTWTMGNIVLDREIDSLARGFGVSIAGGRLVLGVTTEANGSLTLCSKRSIIDGAWHHIAIVRRLSDGRLWLFIDGQVEATADGPDGDISYPDDHLTELESDPHLGFGAWKAETESEQHSFFYGWIDEIRISNSVRYSEKFTPPSARFTSDKNTLALYHIDEGIGDLITDSSNHAAGPSHGSRESGKPSTGGEPTKGTEWVLSDLFQKFFVPLVAKR